RAAGDPRPDLGHPPLGHPAGGMGPSHPRRHDRMVRHHRRHVPGAGGSRRTGRARDQHPLHQPRHPRRRGPLRGDLLQGRGRGGPDGHELAGGTPGRSPFCRLRIGVRHRKRHRPAQGHPPVRGGQGSGRRPVTSRPYAAGMDLFEALYTTRAMRRVSPDPVPEEVAAAMLDAAIRAPSGGNSQNWRFIVVTDPEVRSRLGPLYRRAWDRLRSTVYAGRWEKAQEAGDEAALAVMRSSQWLADNFETVPMWLMAFHRNDPSGASIYPAVWSAMLAARAHGVGTCLTTILGTFEHD